MHTGVAWFRAPPRKTTGAAHASWFPARSDAPDRLQPHARVYFVLAHHHGLRAEAFDDGADMRADAGGSDEDGDFAHLGGILKALLDADDELLQARRGHGEVAVIAVADQRLGEIPFPLRRQ